MTRKIPLTQGQFAIVDEKNYEWLNRWKWYAAWRPCTYSFYVVRGQWNKTTKKKSQIYMAREILGLKKNDKREPDHINHNTLDNRESNLRIVTRQQNSFNRRNVKGCSWNKQRNKYQGRITIGGKRINLGVYRTEQAAYAAYLEAKQKYHIF